ncbi:MAG: hypothetical protein QF619_02545 [Candidatus Binatia bacterium]|nr:hypothetical protein [Candidatus Binatia bacterium]
MGLEPDSRAAPPKDSAPRQGSHEREAWTFRRALRDYRFWALSLGILAGVVPQHMIVIH